MNSSPPFSKHILSFLLAIHLFIAATAMFGGIQLFLTNGLGLPLSFLENSPFTSYVIPASILFFIVGGSQLAAFIMILQKREYAYEVSAVASFGIIIWTFVQLYLLKQTVWLQILYFTLGILSLSLLIFLEKYFPTMYKKEPIHNRHWYE